MQSLHLQGLLLTACVLLTRRALAPPPIQPDSSSVHEFHTRYHVPDSEPPLDLTFWHFGTPLDQRELLNAAACAGTTVSRTIARRGGNSGLLYGHVNFSNVFYRSGNRINITIVDHAEVGRPMNLFEVRDTIKGFALFMAEYEERYMEVDFWIKTSLFEKDVGFGWVKVDRFAEGPEAEARYEEERGWTRVEGGEGNVSFVSFGGDGLGAPGPAVVWTMVE